ncbi:MAG: tryptophan 2,3-dioxygenase family protein [Pseudomonadota bacterium]
MTTELRTHDFHTLIETPEMLDYGVYLQCDKLLSCQTPIASLSTHDEMQFQIVHQVEELWMKLIAFSLTEIMALLPQRHTFKILTLFKRVNMLQQMMIDQLAVLETMSPKDYQAVRLQLGNGSGQESPGFRTLLKMPNSLWQLYKTHYLDEDGLTVKQIYDDQYTHDGHYSVAEAYLDFDEQFQIFRWRHLFLINRSIGISAKSLKGRSVDVLKKGASHRFFPELWDVRSEMTDQWGDEYGVKRDSISGKS